MPVVLVYERTAASWTAEFEDLLLKCDLTDMCVLLTSPCSRRRHSRRRLWYCGAHLGSSVGKSSSRRTGCNNHMPKFNRAHHQQHQHRMNNTQRWRSLKNVSLTLQACLRFVTPPDRQVVRVCGPRFNRLIAPWWAASACCLPSTPPQRRTIP